jgi:hypothetical protein
LPKGLFKSIAAATVILDDSPCNLCPQFLDRPRQCLGNRTVVPVDQAVVAIVRLVVRGQTGLQNVLFESVGGIELTTVAVIDESHDLVETLSPGNTQVVLQPEV